MRSLVDTLAALRGRGAEVVLVSSGAIAAGLAPLGLVRRPRDLATQQAAASVGQGLLVHRYTEELARHGVRAGQVLLTVDDVTRRSHHQNAFRTFARLLELGVLPIVNENDTVATTEIRFGDNDRLAALVAHLVHADLLVLLSDVDGLYTGRPADAGSRLLPDVHGEDELHGIDLGRAGSGGGRDRRDADQGRGRPDRHRCRDPGAAHVGRAVRAPRWPLSRSGRCSIRPVRGAPPGCCGWRTRRRARGSLFLDDGAVRAVVERRASLLPAGITRVSGTFTAGDPVDVVAADGRPVARGLVNYDARELPSLIGRSTRDLARELGSSYEREVIHRDDMVLLPG